MHLTVAGLVELRAFRCGLQCAEVFRRVLVEMVFQPSLNAPHSLGTRCCAVVKAVRAVQAATDVRTTLETSAIRVPCTLQQVLAARPSHLRLL